MKIKKQATARHESTLSPMIADFVRATVSIPLFQLSAHLTSFPKLWPFPRGDTYHWIPVLNRFDRILELFNEEYGLVKGPQTEPFARRLLFKADAEEGADAPQELPTDEILDKLEIPQDGDRELVEQILYFTKLLMENCGNRTLYSSSERLDKLLNTTSTSLVKATLSLSFRLAQRYYAARQRLGHAALHPNLILNHYSISLDKVLKLAAPLPKSYSAPAQAFATPAGKGKEKAFGDRRSESERISSSDMIGLFALSETTVRQEFGGISLSYYEPSSTSDEGTEKHTSTEAPTTPTPRRTLNLQPQQTPRPGPSVSASDTPVTPATPTTPLGGDSESARQSGPKDFTIPADEYLTTDVHEALRDSLPKLPEMLHFELLHRLRTAKSLSRGTHGREDAVAIRLLALANLGYIHNDKDFQSKIGQQDADEPRRLQLAYQLAELVHPPGDGASGVSRELQTLALHALEALAKQKNKYQDVCAALSVNVNHGVLSYVVRKAVAELGVENETSDTDDEWRGALFSLLNQLPNPQARTGEGMVSAGLVEILVEVLTLRTPQAERNYPKVLAFLDTFVYNLRDAFSALVSAKGLDIIADLTSYEVESSIELAKEGKGMPKEYKTQLTDYQIPFYNQQTLRWLFKFVNHMMGQAGGNFDRLLRNLIDSPQLLSGLRTVLSNPTTYGSTVWSMSVNILTSFIHNEPTSYAVIAEAGLSDAFLTTVAPQTSSEAPSSGDLTEGAENTEAESAPRLGSGILPVAEAISTLPAAFGAICLNESGMKVFSDSPALERFFEVFESATHVKALEADPEFANHIGTSFDELVRHHPPLRPRVLACLSNVIKHVVSLCSSKAAIDGVGAKLWTEAEDGTIFVAGGRRALLSYADSEDRASGSRSVPVEGDVDMEDADDSRGIADDDMVPLTAVVETEDSTKGPTTAQYINVLCRFLQGFFGNQTMVSAYIEADGVESILDLATLPSLSPEFNEPHSTGADFGHVVQVLVEQKPHLVIPSILRRAQQALDCLEPLMRHNGKDAFFAPFTNWSPSEMQNSPGRRDMWRNGTRYVKAMVTVHTLVQSLTLTFSTQIYNQRSSHSISSQVNLADMYARLVYSLGRLQQSCFWETILLQKSIPTEWEKETRVRGISAIDAAEAADLLRPSGTDATGTGAPEGTTATVSSNATTSSTDQSAIPSQNSARFKNTQTLLYLLRKVPHSIAPFFQALGKLVLFRRSLDAYQKQCATIVADQLAQAVIDQLQFAGPKESEVLQDKYDYWYVILDSMSRLMIDNQPMERMDHVLTLVLVSFRNLGGLDVLAEVLGAFHETAMSITKTKEEDKKPGTGRLLTLSLKGIENVLDFYAQIISAKAINESPQTTTLQSRPERMRDSPDHFLAAQFLVELRHAVIKPVQKIWNSELMDDANTSIVKVSINILKTVLDGEGEHGAFKSIDKVPTRGKPTIKPWKSRNDTLIKFLTEEGFGEYATEALYRCCDNRDTAKEYCEHQTRSAQAPANPRPSYEVTRTPPITPPSQSEVVVPEAADNASEAGSDDSDDSEGSDTPDSPSVHMEDAGAANEANVAQASQDSNTEAALPKAEGATSTDPSWDFLAYLRRVKDGNVAEPVALDGLDEERANLRGNLIDRSLDILNSHDDVTFDLADLILAAVAKSSDPATMRSDIGSTLVQSLISLQTDNEEDFRKQGKKIAASAHLLGLVVSQDKEFYDAMVDELKESFAMLLSFIKIFPNHPPEESSPWVGQVLLIMERLLSEDQLPRQIEWSPPIGDDREVSVEQIPEPVVSLDEKLQLFDAIIDVLPRVGKDEVLAHSLTRVLMMLTRNRKIAIRLAEKRNIQRLFLMVRQLAGITREGLRTAFMIVLRHIIEDETIIRQIMQTEIQSAFEQRDRRQTDTTAYTRQMYYLALRDPEIFVEVTNEKLQLKQWDPLQRPQHLVLKRDEASASDPDNTPSAGAADTAVEGDKPKESSEPRKGPVLERTKTSDLKPPVVEKPDGVIHYLLCELLAYKEVDDKAEIPKAPTSSEATTGAEPPSADTATSSASAAPMTEAIKPVEKVEFKAEAHPIYVYRCFLLKCLAELLQSYTRTKVEFINFSRKADPHASTPSKPRSGVLNYLLTSLVPVGTLSHEGDLSFKKKAATSGCAVDVIVSLCAKTTEKKPPPNPASPYAATEADLLFVRKFVLEHALKAFKDASASDEPLEMKYSRLMNIADIFSRMVSQRADGNPLNANQELTPALKQMAKVMYEKNFITVLTTAIADIDLNFPDAKRAVKYILKPLKWLCQVAVDLSTHYDTSATPGSTDEYEISSASDDDMVGATREETPDLFRNSTLGMYEPHESDSEHMDDEEDQEMYGDDMFEDEMGMEYEEEVDADEVVSDEDEDMDGMGPIEGLPGDAVDVEVILDDDDHDHDGDSDDDEDDDDDLDDDSEDDMDDDDDDMDDMDDMDDIEEMEDMEEITGDDENASLDGDSWSGDNGDFGGAGEINAADIPPALGFVLDDDNPQEMLNRIQHLHPMDAELDDFMDDVMQEDEDDEDGEEEFEEDVVFNPGPEDDEDADMPWAWDEDVRPPRHAHRLSPWMFPGGPGERMMVPGFRTHRPGHVVRPTDDGVNPLLQRAGRSGRGDHPSAGHHHDHAEFLRQLSAGRGFTAENPVSFISNLLNVMSQHGGGPMLHQHNGALHLEFRTPGGELPPLFDPSFITERVNQRSRETHVPRSVRQDPYSAVAFHKAFTITRWQEEARILYGNAAAEKSQRLISSILKVLTPAAIEAYKKRAAEKEAEIARKLKEDRERMEEQERKEKQEREEREAREAKEREEAEQQQAATEQAAEQAAEQPVEQASEQTQEQIATTGDDQTMEGVETTESAAQPPAEQSAAAGPSERRIARFGDREVDITDLGIDMEYLEALPEELREEVLIQQVTERARTQVAETGGEPPGIDPEFLNALPPEIQAEILQQEAQDRRRRERDEARRRAQPNDAPRAEPMDNASFFATLDPQLRQIIVSEQDEDMLRHLPPEIAREAELHGGDRRLNQFNDFLPQGHRRGDRRAQQDDLTQKKKARPCVQMLDKSGVATLLRLMFIPQQGSAKAGLSHILRCVCENRQNRAEVISILLSILQDGSADENAVERSFAQLSLRAKQPQQGTDKTPKFSRKNTAQSIMKDVSPLMVVQQCLHALWQLTDKNPPVWSFFLSEHETAVGFKSRSNRKGKGKETKATKYPLNALLGLLDRKIIVESSTIMEQLTTLLRVITGPLQVLRKVKETAKENEEAPTSEEGQSSSFELPSTVPTQAPPDNAPVPQTEDTEMVSAPEVQAEPAPEGEGSASKAVEKTAEEDKSKKHRMLVPPEVPETNLRLVARILAARECNSKVFQETLSIINNLSPIPGAKETFGKELLGIAQDLAQDTLKDLATLTLQVTQAETPTDVQGMALSKFSPPSSDQAKLLRALTALDYLFDPARDSADKNAEALEPAQKQDILLSLYESPTFAGLWQKLSECLSVIRQRGNMLNIATILLPLIEALMVVCKNTTLKDMPITKIHPKEMAVSSPPPEDKMESLFFTFTEDHRKILNDLVRQNPKLMSGTFSLLVKNSKVLEFDNKRNYFTRKLHARSADKDRHPHPPLQLSVRRDQVFMDSFRSLYFKTADEMKYGKLSIRFHGEEGVDAGGVTREWFQVIARQMFNPDYALFDPVASDRTTFHPNRLSSINPEHLMFFKFIGRIIGKALYEGRVLDCHFSRAVYKRILSRPVNLKDMENLDLNYYNSLQWMLSNNITDNILETFSLDVEAFGETKTVDLISNGRNIPVTEENKHDYVRLVTEHRLTGAVHEQLEHFLKGFHDIVPAELVAIFSEQELELLISGLPEISVDDWKNNTEYHGYTAASPQIQWFWRAVRSFDKEERAKLLQFVTGTSKVPLNGFKELEGMNGFSRFNIHRDYGNKDRLPSSHTCFNQLDLPEYETYEDLRKQLYTAMTAGGEYFGFA